MLHQGSSPEAAAEGGSDLASASIRPSVRASTRPSALLPRAVGCEDWVFSSLPPNDVIPRDDHGEATYLPSTRVNCGWLSVYWSRSSVRETSVDVFY